METSSLLSGVIAIVGRPNAGKSTLLNRVVGARLSIVTPKAQTTRERLKGILTESGRGQILFVDTPGIHRAREGGFNEFMVSEAREALSGTDLVWYLVDPNSALEHEEPVIELVSRARTPVFLIWNKIDRDRRPGLGFEEKLPAMLRERGAEIASIFGISALKGTGVSELLAASWSRMPQGPILYPDEEMLSDRPMRYFVGEKIREQLFRNLGDELPYSCAVSVDRYEETATPLRIEATIFVERESQKGMVVGRGGQKIKEIGQAARREIEKFLDSEHPQKIFLGLNVKTLKDWTRDRKALERLGYVLPEERRP